MNTQTPSEPLTTTKRGTFLKALSVIVLLNILIILGFVYSRTVLKDKEITRQKEIELINQKILEDNSAQLQVFSEYSSHENQALFLEKSNESLSNPDILTSTKNTILLRKAIVSSAIKGSPNQESYVADATQIYKDFIYSRSTDSGSQYLKDFSIVAAVKLHLQCCFSAKLFSSTTTAYENYKAMGYDDKLTKLLLLDDLSRQISSERSLDVSHISNLLFIDLTILSSYKDKLTADTKTKILGELKKDLDSFIDAKPIFYTDIANTVLQPKLHYALAYDIYHENVEGSLTDEKNKEIDANYEAVLKSIESLEYGTKNSQLANEMRFYYSIGYLYSLDKRYKASLDKEKKENLIKDILSSIRASKENEAIAKIYFKDAKQNGDYVQSVAYYFLSLANTNKEVADYVSSIRK